MVEDLRQMLAPATVERGGGGEPRLTMLMLVATGVTAALVMGSLRATTPDSDVVMVGMVVVSGTIAVVGAYFGLPRFSWLPLLPASVTVAVVLAATGGSASPYWPLLLVLLVGGATQPQLRDFIVVVMLVVAAALSPLTYEAWSDYATIATGLQAASWMLAALIVARVSDSLRAARDGIEQRTRLVSEVLSSLPQQAAVVDSSGTILLTNDAWDRVHMLSGASPETFAAGRPYETACRSRYGVVMASPTGLVDDLRRVLDGKVQTAVSELSWELLVGEPHRFTVRTTALPNGLGAVVTHEDITRLVQSDRASQSNLEHRSDGDRPVSPQAVSRRVSEQLTAMIDVADMLNRNATDLGARDLRQLAGRLDGERQRLTRLLTGLVVLSLGADYGPTVRPTIQPALTNVREVIHAVVDRVDPEQHRIIIEAPDSGLAVSVDPWLLECILDQLIDNAIRHTPDQTTILISVQAPDASTLTVRVDDNGPGIPTEEHGLVLHPFQQGGHCDQNFHGAGIGLAAVQHAARLHGGDAWIDTSPAGGTSVSAQLAVEPPHVQR